VTAKGRILTVDRNQRNLELLEQFLQKQGYETVPVSTLENFEQILAQADSFGIALVDISGFDRSIWSYCEQLSTHEVPLLILSPPQLKSIRQESLAHGAQDVLFKPLIPNDFVSLVRTMIRDNQDG
jgi:DNA-binding response OmpR family regulator